jgi:hypothetical protein
MNLPFVNSFQSEWLKTRRSLSAWLVVVGSLFTPAIIVIARLVHRDKLPGIYAADDFWSLLWRSSWESMAVFFLPMGAILATSLMTQIEYKNNTWKHVHTLPLSLTTIFFSKLAVILLLLVQFLILFSVGIYLAGVIPCLLVGGVPYPSAPIPHGLFLKEDGLFFIDCLPIVALQYLISLRFRNFLVPVGAGFVIWVGALAALSWKFSYVVPYTYCMINYLKAKPGGKIAIPDLNFHAVAVGYFLLFTIAGYGLFALKKEKG